MNESFSTNVSFYNNKNNTFNTTTSSPETCLLDEEDILIFIGYMLVFLIGTSGNGLVLFFYRKNFKHGPVIETLILYLAFFNFLSSILDPMVFGYWILTCQTSWDFGEFGCKVLPSLCRVSTNASIGIILIMAIDRCRVIVSPLGGHLKHSTVHKCVFATVILGFCSEINYMYGLYITKTGSCSIRDLHDFKGYSVPLVVLVTLRVLAIIIILACTTTAASYKLNTSRKSTMLLSNSNPDINKHLTHRFYKVTRMLVVMAIVFAITVIPRDIFHLVYTISWISPGEGLPGPPLKKTNTLLKLLQTSNVIYNVFIYAGMYAPFRKLVKSALTCKKHFMGNLSWRHKDVRHFHHSMGKNKKDIEAVNMTTCYDSASNI